MFYLRPEAHYTKLFYFWENASIILFYIQIFKNKWLNNGVCDYPIKCVQNYHVIILNIFQFHLTLKYFGIIMFYLFLRNYSGDGTLLFFHKNQIRQFIWRWNIDKFKRRLKCRLFYIHAILSKFLNSTFKYFGIVMF